MLYECFSKERKMVVFTNFKVRVRAYQVCAEASLAITRYKQKSVEAAIAHSQFTLKFSEICAMAAFYSSVRGSHC